MSMNILTPERATPDHRHPVTIKCTPPVRWLIIDDRGVASYIQDFIDGRASSDVFDVAGPPLLQDVEGIRRGRQIRLPQVTLRLERDIDVNGRVLRVLACDKDIAVIQSWMLRKQRGDLFTTTQPWRPQW